MKNFFLIFLSMTAIAHATQYKSFRLESTHLTNGLRVTGKVIPMEGTLYIESARFVGRVSSMLVKEGDEVVPGKKLLSVNSAECQSLFQEKKVAAQKHLDDMKKVVGVRETQLSMKAEENACYIVASKAGVITKKMVEAGSNFNIGDNLFTLVNKNSLTVELDIPERDASKLKVGQKVSITRTSDPNTIYKSEINAIVPSLNTISRTVKARLKKIQFKNNPSLDEFVYAQIQLGSDDVLFKVPASAIVFHEDKDYLLKLVNGKLQKVEIVVVSETPEGFLVKEKNFHSIQVNDEIVSDGAVFQMQKLTGEK